MKIFIAPITAIVGDSISDTVSSYADLPDPASFPGEIYLIQNSTGFLWNRRKGLYRSNGTTWERLSNAVFQVRDNEAVFVDNDDETKKMEFQLDQIPSGTTRTIRPPKNNDGELSIIGYIAGHIYGLKLSPNATNPAYQLDIAPGGCISDDGTTYMENSGAITVDITASGANGLDTGSEATSTWYYVFLIWDESSGAVAGLISASASSPTLPSGYTKKRRIGSARNNAAGNFIPALQTGNGGLRVYCFSSAFSARIALSGGSATVSTAVDLSAYTPPTNSQTRAYAAQVGSGLAYVQFTAGGADIYGIQPSDTITMNVPTAGAQSIAYRNAGGAGSVYIIAIGYVEEV